MQFTRSAPLAHERSKSNDLIYVIIITELAKSQVQLCLEWGHKLSLGKQIESRLTSVCRSQTVRTHTRVCITT